ncbi:uncharacterized protein [Ambystoma mexicanum]|uniref:uncharacterized protein n=1 Tax=Ambystoma mexicanum TaxID=8296 RepID=UPI0037E9AEE8
MAGGGLLPDLLGLMSCGYSDPFSPGLLLHQAFARLRSSEDLGHQWSLGPWARVWAHRPGYLWAPLGLWQEAPLSLLGQHFGVSDVKQDMESWSIMLDPRPFLPEHLLLKAKDGYLEISGTLEEEDLLGYVSSSRHFKRRYRIPPQVAEGTITAIMRPDGILRVKAPLLKCGLFLEETQIPILVEAKNLKETGSLSGRKDEPEENLVISQKEQPKRDQTSQESPTNDPEEVAETNREDKKLLKIGEASRYCKAAVEEETEISPDEIKDVIKYTAEEVEKQTEEQVSTAKEAVHLDNRQSSEVPEGARQGGEEQDEADSNLLDYMISGEVEKTNRLEAESLQSHAVLGDVEDITEDSSPSEETYRNLLEQKSNQQGALEHVQETISDHVSSLEPEETKINRASVMKAEMAALAEYAISKTLPIIEEEAIGKRVDQFEVSEDEDLSQGSSDVLPLTVHGSKKTAGEDTHPSEQPVMHSDVTPPPANVSPSAESSPGDHKGNVDFETSTTEQEGAWQSEMHSDATQDPEQGAAQQVEEPALEVAEGNAETAS